MVIVLKSIKKIFFFSSRRRHTRLVSDWSSDVCSSDLAAIAASSGTGADTRTDDACPRRVAVGDRGCGRGATRPPPTVLICTAERAIGPGYVLLKQHRKARHTSVPPNHSQATINIAHASLADPSRR